MNCSDHYQDLLLYLEQTENEITQAFEKGAQKCSLQQTKATEINGDSAEKNDIEDIELDFLIKLNETIKSDISELLAKNEINENNISDCQFYTEIDTTINGYSYINDGEIITLSDHNGINAATQTSPSLSPSSTNLTWASECSSSPCLTSTSDSDLLDEDAQSTSSTDGKDHLAVTWAVPTQCWQNVLLGIKSSSAPILKREPTSPVHSPIDTWLVSSSNMSIRVKDYKFFRSLSVKVNDNWPVRKAEQIWRQLRTHKIAEIEAAEACKWLRATGFSPVCPAIRRRSLAQYSILPGDLGEDMQFPIDVTTAAQDHPLLESDVLHSLFRRLQILNSCAHLHQQRVTHTDESEDEYCALSDNWTYQTDIRRWSRTCNRIPNQNMEEASKRLDVADEEKGEVFEKCTESPKERLRRAGSTKFRRRRDGVLFSDKNNVLDKLTRQLSDIKPSEVNHVSDSEITPRHTRRTRTKSFDKTDTWSHSHSTTDRIIWHKLPGKEVPRLESDVSVDDNGPLMSHLSCTQLQVLRKLALLKLTAHMEKYCPSHRTGWNWKLPKFIRKIKTPVYKVGIFRKPGVKSRILALRNLVEASVGVNYGDQQCYDVADMVKQYFRELPEALLTNKLSETFILIFQHVPQILRRESILCALLLMPDEHLEVLQGLLHFLLSIAKHSQVNQMNESNLAMCFCTLAFHYSQAYKQNLGSPHPKELAENKAGHECLLYFLKHFNTLFRVPQEFLNQCKTSEIKDTRAKLLTDLGAEIGGWNEYMKECQTNLLKEAKEKCRGWIPVASHNPKVEINYKKVADGLPLRLWKVSADIEAPPSEVLHRILRERHIWDPDLHSAKILAQLEKKAEVFLYVRKNINPLPLKEYCIVRTWKTDLPKDACLIVETSVEYPDIMPVPNSARAIVLASRYLIEPCGSGKSRLLHLSRVDTMGRTPEWYQKNFGHLCALFLGNIQSSF
ncbi:hypothetical protein NQ317_007708 [Molorchus minor]|uniref:Rho GTPase-activating protein 7 n=1 Tax=Molorchus minor TaxID=1323400 RepID=A0ABQ9J0E1_9CUCU|nr:hypothetical protein NQ317_007708 [Molorchus minor]